MASKLKYDDLVIELESKGLTREQITIDQTNTNLVTLQTVAANATNWAIDIRAPAGQKITIMGTQQVAMGADARTAHSLRVRFADSGENELAFNTTVKIDKTKSSTAIVPLTSMFYADANLTKVPTGQAASTTVYKTDPEYYRFKQGIELNGEQRLRLSIVNTLGTVNAVSTPSAMVSTATRFALECDLWS